MDAKRDSEGTARFVVSESVDMRTDGECLSGTLACLKAGYVSKPMPDDQLLRVRRDALALLEKVLREYDTKVAEGEVGVKGTARASVAAPRSGGCPTGLLYGRVQSGKTVAMIAFSAAALDNGFRVIVVLTSNYLKLVEQTAKRFGALSGPIVKDSFRIDDWNRDIEHIKAQVADHGLVLVCAKDQAHLSTLVTFLHDVGAAGYPALVLDDEADQATPDTTTAARSAQRPNAPQQGSTIHRRTIRNDASSEEGESVRESLPHNVFVQVTATPYALLLQNSDHPLRPRFTELLEVGAGYTGGEEFFGTPKVEDEGRPSLIYVDEDEGQSIQNGSNEVPLGLKKAVSFFLVSAAAQAILEPSMGVQGQNFLCHTSPRTTEHDRLAELIRTFLAKVDEDIKRPGVPGETGVRLGWAIEELARTLDPCPELDAIVGVIKRRLPRREIPIVNSASSPAEFGRELNFIVGGNILGRGLTIENLLVTYYLRKARTSQMDTVLQHARMFGYRAHLMPFTRVFLPESLAFRFNGIHLSEERLRKILSASGPGSRIPVQTPLSLRATRLNVLEAGSLSAYGPGEQVYPIAPALDALSAAKYPRLEAELKEAFGGALRPNEFVPTPIDTLIALMTLAPFPESDAGNWDPDMLGKILHAIAPQYGNKGSLYYRPMERNKKRLVTGSASGSEVAGARAQGLPVLFLFRDSGAHFSMPFWYPTLVLPENMNTMVFNIT